MKEQHEHHFPLRRLSVGDAASVRNFGHGPKWVAGEVTILNGHCLMKFSSHMVERHIDHIRVPTSSFQVWSFPQS